MAQESQRPEFEDNETSLSKTEAHQKITKGERLWEDLPSEEVVKERNEIVELLEKYDDSAGTDTSRFRELLRKEGNKPSELAKLKEKLVKMADKEWLRRAENHEAFNAPGKLGELLGQEMKDLHSNFKGLKLKDGAVNKFSVLTEMEDMLEAKAKFVRRYKKQTPLVQELFEQSMNELGFKGSKEKHLNDVLELVGGLEHSPEAIQHEFKKRAEKIHNIDRLKVLKATLIKEYGEMDSQYEKGLNDAKEYFGGDTAKQFMDYWRSQDSFTKMRYVLRVLPKYIEERKEEHEKIEELLQHVDEKKAQRFRDIVGQLGLSERQAYRKGTLEPAVRTGNLMVAEYEGELLAAKSDQVPLYSDIERSRLAARFKTMSLKDQRKMLFAERMNIQERKRVIRDYHALPDKVRDDASFYKANANTREELLHSAIERKLELEKQSAFEELDADENLSDDQIHEITAALEKTEGEKAMDEAFEEQVSEREKKNLSNVISLVNWKAGYALEANALNENQKETYIRDREHFKVGMSEGDTEKDATLESDWLKASMIRESQMAADIYDKGFTSHANSSVHERQDLKRSDMTDLKGEKIAEAMNRAKYSTDIHLAEDDEKEPLDVAAMLGEVVEAIAEKMAREMAEGIADRIKAHGSNRLTLVNSLSTAKNKETLKQRFWDKEMGERGKVFRAKRNKKAA